MTNIFNKVQTAKHLKEREDLINLKDDWLIDTLMPSSQAGILVAPFTLMSRKPGIAGQYYQDHPEVYDYRYINIPGQEGGIKFTVPRYFDRLLEKEDPEALARMKVIRQKIVTELDKEKDTKTTYGTKNRLEVEARQKEAVAKMLRRSAI